jgi:Na+/H+ antiporter NhaA
MLIRFDRCKIEVISGFGLELKREILEGQLASKEQVVLPIIGAIGGFFVPAAIYVAINWGNASALNGWALRACRGAGNLL